MCTVQAHISIGWFGYQWDVLSCSDGKSISSKLHTLSDTHTHTHTQTHLHILVDETIGVAHTYTFGVALRYVHLWSTCTGDMRAAAAAAAAKDAVAVYVPAIQRRWSTVQWQRRWLREMVRQCHVKCFLAVLVSLQAALLVLIVNHSTHLRRSALNKLNYTNESLALVDFLVEYEMHCSARFIPKASNVASSRTLFSRNLCPCVPATLGE